MRARTLVASVLVAGVVVAVAAVAVPAGTVRAAAPASAAQYSAEIRWTTGGVPHILADNWGSLGFGYGDAFAQDNLCTMAEDYVTIEAQRSLYFGPAGTYVQRANGTTVTNLDSDVFYQQIINSGVVASLTRDLDPRLVELNDGYVAGYNHYLASVGGAAGVPDPSCRGQAWVQPITPEESLMRFYQLMLESSQGLAINSIASAAPPASGSPASASTAAKHTAAKDTAAKDAAAEDLVLKDPQRAAAELTAGLHSELAAEGSNAVAIGSSGSRNGHGLLLGNPHFPWIGSERFFQAQLTIPGQLNVTGASLYGVPLILIGHTATVAWSHTVSTAFRFTLYQLSIVPGHPTSYYQNGHPVAMTPSTVTVPGPNGTSFTRTLWSTRYGPVLSSLSGLPLPWTSTSAYAMRDANAGNLSRALNTWFGFDQAKTTGDILSTLKKYQGIPWVNTIAVDKQGQALYADIGSIPGVPDSLAKSCDIGIGVFTFAEAGLPVLDGSRTACDWRTGPGAAAPGLLGPSQEPYLLRTDYVTNSNDSYWLANPHHPLTGYPRIIGSTDSARSLRTRIGLIEVQARIDGTDGEGRPGFTVPLMQQLDLNDLDYAAKLTLPALVQMCRSMHGVAPTSSGKTVRLGDACDALAGWDMHWDPSQRGAELFGAFWSVASSGQPFAHPFNPANPVNTPYGLDTSSHAVRVALGDAVQTLDKEHIALDAPLGSVQYVSAGGRQIPIPGGPGDPDGIFNAIYVDSVAGDSPTAPDEGSSFIQIVSFNSGACPTGETILTYSESSDAGSPHYADQTALFSHKQMLPDRFCQQQIMSDPHLQITYVSGSD
jgi:acyl-homoserine-lactone acylase